MILWINGAFGAGKTTAAFELQRRIENSFVYDPENVGYFIRRNAPPDFSKGDFQNIPLWREMNYKMLKLILSEYNGTLIVPMTLVNPDYYNEIIAALINDGVDVKHYILYASKDTLIKRLNNRGRKETWAKAQVDRCIDSFDNHIKDTKIMTDDKKIDDVVEEIAKKSNIVLLPDKRSGIKKFADRNFTLIRHIRWLFK